MRLEVTNFFKHFIINPYSRLLDKTDRLTALICSVTLGIFTLGIPHVVCFCFFRSYKPLPTGTKTKELSVAQRALPQPGLASSPDKKIESARGLPPDGEASIAVATTDEEHLTKLANTESETALPPDGIREDSIAVVTTDEERLAKLGFTLDSVASQVKDFFNSSDSQLSLGPDRSIIRREGVISLNFSDGDKDVNFILKKALERAHIENPADCDNLFFHILQAYQTLNLAYQEIIDLHPFIKVPVQECSPEALTEVCSVPSSLLLSSPPFQRAIFPSFFSFSGTACLTLPENYSLEHFKAYIEMSSDTTQDISSEDTTTLVDMLQLADYFENKELFSRLDAALKAPTRPTLEGIAYLLERLAPTILERSASADSYALPLETYISPFINALINRAISLGDPPLDELVGKLHSLDKSAWLQTHSLTLNLAPAKNKVTDTVLENLSSLKISHLTINSSEVTHLPDIWATTLQNLSIINTKIEALPSLAHLKSLKVKNNTYSEEAPNIDLSALNNSTSLENLHLEGLSIEQVPQGLTGLKSFTAVFCHELRDLTHLNGCAQLEGMHLHAVPIEQLPLGLTGLKSFTAADCRNLRDLTPLNNCEKLEEINLSSLATIEQLPLGLRGLKSFTAADCPHLRDLTPLNNCEKLEEINLSSLVTIEQVPLGLTGLKKCTAKGCPLLRDLTHLSDCTQLEELILESSGIEIVPRGLEGLKRLSALECANLRDLDNLSGCEKLEGLHLENLPSLTVMPVHLTGLKRVNVDKCPSLRNLDKLNGSEKLEDLTLQELAALETVPTGLKGLKRFTARSCPVLRDLDNLSGCDQMEDLKMMGLIINRVPRGLKSLKFFQAYRCDSLADFSHLSDCKKLEEMDLLEVPIVEVPEGLEALKVLKLIAIHIKNLDNLNGCKELEKLCLQSVRGIKSLPRGLKKLKIFNANFCPDLADIDNLNGSEKLEELNVSQMPIKNVPRGLKGLKKILASLCDELKDLSALDDCSQLTNVVLEYLPKLSIIPLRLREVREKRIVGCPLIR